MGTWFRDIDIALLNCKILTGGYSLYDPHSLLLFTVCQIIDTALPHMTLLAGTAGPGVVITSRSLLGDIIIQLKRSETSINC